MTDPSVRENGCINGGNRSANARTCYSSLKLSDLVDYLNAADRAPLRTAADAAHRRAAMAEVEEVGVVVARS